MELEITRYNNFFKIKGILNKRNVDLFQKEFNHIFDTLSSITISIESIEWMDHSGVKAFVKLNDEAVLKNKKLSIIGLGCKELYDHFKTEIAA